MNASALSCDWRQDVRDMPITTVAEALALQHTGRGEQAKYVLPHADCAGAHSDGSPAVFIGSSNRLICRRCDTHMSAVDVVALDLGLDPDRLDGAGWGRVRDVSASRGWCMPDPHAIGRPVDAAVWQAERDAIEAERQARADAIEAQRRASAIDVHAAWLELTHAQVGHDIARRWARDVRSVPTDLLDHLPFDSLAAVPGDHPPPCPALADPRHWPEAIRLLSAAWAVDRHILIAQRDAEARPVGASRRWHRRIKPADDLPKALALNAAMTLAGRPGAWLGGAAIFGDLPIAASKARNAEPVFIVEGGPDWMIAAAALRMGRRGAVLGSPGASVMAKVAGALRTALWVGPPMLRRPHVVIIPDRGQAGERAAWLCRQALQAAADVTVMRTGHDDLNDMVRDEKMTGADVAGWLLGAAS